MQLLNGTSIFPILMTLFHFVATSHVGSYKVYIKSSSQWRTVNYTDPDDSDIDQSMPGIEKSIPPLLSSPEECARPCKTGDPPKTCYYQWTFETYHTLGGACELCTPTTNTSLSSNCQCILADGADVSGIIVANRQFPGPAIQVCLGDMVIVDVKNIVPGNHLSIHWHGIYQKDWQHYDGVPFLTQCPISECSTFRYQWRAQNPGSHFWHAHSGLHKADGVDGPIIIREPPEFYPNRDLFNHDNFDNFIFIQDWLHNNALDHFPGTSINSIGQNPDNFLVNGRGQWLDPSNRKYTTTPLAIFNVKPGERYRFRMINGCTLLCPIELQIENHNMTIIAVDGVDVRPEIVNTITSFAAERVDFVLNTYELIGTYWIQVRGLSDNCTPRSVQQHAILRYEGSDLDEPSSPRPQFQSGLPRGKVFNPVNDVCDGTTANVICIKDLQNANPVNDLIFGSQPDMQIYLPFFFHNYERTDLFRPNTYQRFVDPINNLSVAAIVDGISNIFPPSPPISQLDDIPADILCPDPNNLPARCDGLTICHCAHFINIPLNSLVEIIVADIGPLGISHPFHLHGYSFHVMSTGLLSRVNITDTNKSTALQRDREEYPPISDNPPMKDTLAVPSGGYTIVRFIADNPGWWLYHCHFLQHLFNGMSVVFHIGQDSDLPPTPKNFPKCGNFEPSILRTNPVPRGEL
ncbi:hypothetical protein PV326_011020 [Microctonus aethiopoides]|uniref:Laccase n=2 Tax=Microctonus aethiopoides TaxID=144406 RepID=A0AA39FJ85_9HYME|nr:hypothetical protein PV326_011020 [Microctonus aethiopoides]KAK0170609.1 hypothetical protein PV328_008445 [Microctonus aethiopoides]